MADKGNINPKELAKDIQKNVDAALHDPTNAKALEALHKDAQLLDGHLSQKKDGQFVDHNKVLQDKVQAELNKLEASGALPKVEINMSGQIEAPRGCLDITQWNYTDVRTKVPIKDCCKLVQMEKRKYGMR